MTIQRLLLAALALCVGLSILHFPETGFSIATGMLIALSTSSTLIFISFTVILLVSGTPRQSTYTVEQAQPAFERRTLEPVAD